MKARTALVLATCLWTGVPVYAQSRAQVEQEILDARNAFAAAVDRHDAGAMARLVTDDFVWITDAGDAWSGPQLLARIKSATRGGTVGTVTSLDTAKPQVFAYGNAAVIVGVQGQRFLSVWVRRADGWRAAAMQFAPIGGPDRSARPVIPATRTALTDFARRSPEEQAVLKVYADILRARATGDADLLANRVADPAVAVLPDGAVETRGQTIGALQAGESERELPETADAVTHFQGHFAWTTLTSIGGAGATRQLVVSVKERGKWLRAASIATEIVEATAVPAR